MDPTRPHTHFSGLIIRLALLGSIAVMVSLGLVTSSTAVVTGAGPVKDARIFQAGKKLILEVRTDRKVNLGKLERQPNLERPHARYLCFELTRGGSKLINRICIGGRKKSRHRVGITRTNRAGKVFAKDTIAAHVERSGDQKLAVSIEAKNARLRPAGYAWKVVQSSGLCVGEGRECRTNFPERHHARYRIRPLEIVGCTGGVGDFVTHGPRGRKRIALTFDDGPSLYSPDVLHILKAHDVKATFFMIGQEVERYPDTARSILRHGHELANHTTHHQMLPSASDLAKTSSIIKHATGFKPCSFRPPGGAVNSSVISAAAATGMNTITWDIDTNDWRLPGSGSIYNQITNARSGSIVLMHDGGGPRSQTIQALADGIENLQNRGYKLVTVAELLGNDFKYRPKK